MAENHLDKQAAIDQFYTKLYACVWENLEPFLGAQTTLALISLGTRSLQHAYPFLSQLAWQTQGLAPASLRAAIVDKSTPHIQAGCERLLQEIQSLVQNIWGDLLAQRVLSATERLRLDFEPALSTPAAADELKVSTTPADPQEAALPMLHDMAQRALDLYCRLQSQQADLEHVQSDLQTLRNTNVLPPGTVDHTLASQDDLARSEAFYHNLFDLSPDGVVLTNFDGIILQANPKAAEIMEFDTPEELIGRNATEFYVHPEERDTLLQRLVQERYLEGYRRELRTRRGKTIVILSSYRLIDYDGESYLLAVLRDVTERARLRQEMEDFAYSASHDLQAPLRTFEGYARWLLEDYGDALDDMGRQLCEEIIADALHMKKLLDGLLEYSRIGRMHTQPAAVDVQKVLDQVMHSLQLEIVDTDATIDLPPNLPTVYYPEVRLTQIFSNLLSNALKFTAGKTPHITVGCDIESQYYRFTVRDNGIGIAPEHVGRIFEIFKRLHTREEYPGTGAGLTIVKKIVESHGGQIGVESVPGEGSTFWFTIPRTEDQPCAS
jgi:PAS domain S-box-containing protein